MFIAIDIGNTMLKAAFFRQSAAEEVLVLPADTHMDEFVAGLNRWLSVSSEVEALASCSGHWPVSMPKEVKLIKTASNWPLEIHYDTPQTLGLDRLLLANATWLEFQDDLLVITMGTCITYNIVKNGALKGGAISPGLQMRFRAMNHYTSDLPLVEGNLEAPILGTSTEGSLQAGVNVAIAKEVEGMSAQFCHEFDLDTVFICGGDRNALRNHLKKYIFAPSNYELHALKRIHEYFKNQGLS
ncbi:MAG TPA: hypothetical protein DCQ41_04875 [Cryomorphaceae bacterium]|nr:hypothetical protein [Cryomorphaceae bacterium]